ncbi:DUF1769-domain-containing protein [Trichocladium antarcticum]|uniref:DUF1769-domain-containing protein n=1 Tax=Trichocladium antarcticum TaxID=1450529 RepID=A0AAN6UHI3_9PEZI|nr:DUF1769-domain-containing protein [Trichocladium antarcticum]
MAEKYLLRVTAGPDYDVAGSHVEVPVNSPAPIHIASAAIDADLCVRVKDYRGLPRSAPTTSGYFAAGRHAVDGDTYRNEGEQIREGNGGDNNEDAPGVPATDLQFGNDFDHPIRDRLPPGFGTAMNIVKWWIDPGLEGDPYADTPYLYGPALSSFNAVHVGDGECDDAKGGLWVEEGGDAAGMDWRRGLGAPDDARARMKWALGKAARERWVWEYGRAYGVDFFNPYIDFGEFALRLPGFNLPIMRYWDGQGLRRHRKRSHHLRYVLRNRATGQVYLVVVFTLHLAEDVNEDGTLKPAGLRELGGYKGEPEPVAEPELELEPDEEDFAEEEALGEARRRLSGAAQDDVD